MSYLGGSATTTGIQYQNWFLALQVAFSFFETNRLILPEAFTDDVTVIDDIKIIQDRRATYFNVKYRSPAPNLHWNQSQLISQSIVKHFKEQHEKDENAQIVFVSESNCYLFTEVFHRAKNARSPAEIEMVLQSERCIELWYRAMEVFGYTDFQLLALARKVTMRSLPLFEIQKLIEHRFTALGNHKAVAKLFFTKSIECSADKRRIDKEDINRWLVEDGIHFK